MPFLHLKDTELYYEVHGRGQPMVFLSETACDGEVWKLYQVEEFSRDHQVILHDYRGTGRSDKPSIEYSTKMFCDDAAALMDHLGVEKAIVIGHSMGGRIAQLLALDYPKKVDKLVLASTGAAFPATKGLPLKICQEMIEWGYERYERDHSILVGFTDEFAKKYPERVEKYLQVRMANLCPVEFYSAPSDCAPESRYNRPSQGYPRTHTYLGGGRRPQRNQRHQPPELIRNPRPGNSECKACGAPRGETQLFLCQPRRGS